MTPTEKRLAAATDAELEAEAAATATAAAMAERFGKPAHAARKHLDLIHAERARRAS